jgi:hypothetical protein
METLPKQNYQTVTIAITPNPCSPANLAQPWLIQYLPVPTLVSGTVNIITYKLDTPIASNWNITGFGGLSLLSQNIKITLNVPGTTSQMSFLPTDGTFSPPPAQDMTGIAPSSCVIVTVDTTRNTNSHLASFYLQYTNSLGGVLIDDPEVQCPGSKG